MNDRRTSFWPAVARLAALASLVGACAEEPAPQHLVRDDLGREVRVRSFDRIVTLAPNLTEIVYAIGAGPRLAATDDYSDEPKAAAALPKVGGLNPNVERIAAIRPDAVFATTNGNPPSLEPALGAAGIPLFVVRTDRLDDIPRSMTLLGSLFGAAGAERAAADVRSAIAAQRRERATKPRVLFAVWTEPLYVGGRNTFADDLLQLTGAENAVDVGGWPQLSLESIAAKPPDLLLYPDRSVKPAQIDALIERVPALRATRVVAVDENLFTRPGPRVGAAAAALNTILDQWERSGR